MSSTSSAMNQASLHFDVEGITGNIKENVMQKLAEEAVSNSFNTWYAASQANVQAAMAPFGYFDPQIKSQVTQVNGIKQVRFIIVKGQPVVVHSISVRVLGEGKADPIIHKAISDSPIQKNALFNSQEYEKFKSKVLETANEQGYVKSYWDDGSVRINRVHHQATIELRLQTKNRYYFSSVKFHQTKDAYAQIFLQRFSLSAPTGNFSSEKLIDYQQKLAASQYFRGVDLAPSLDINSNNIPINANVTAPPAKKYMLGLGYSTWSGPRFLSGVILRHINNVGHYVETQVKMSPVISAFSAKYYIPGHNPLTQQWIMGINAQRFLPKYGSSSSSTFLLGYNVKNDDWQTNLALNYLVEHYKIQSSNAETTALLYPSLSVSHSKADDPIYPNHAHNVSLLLRGSSKAALSSTNFIQGIFNTKYLYSVFDGTRIIAKGDIGYTVVQDVTNLPLSLRFFMGGANSIRGFRDCSIGPGKYLLLGSLELQQRIYHNWEMAVFYDQGKATNHLDSPWNKSVGIGGIYASVIGPIKLYLARDISLEKKPYRVEFSFGPEF